MIVPGLKRGIERRKDLHEAHAGLDEATRQKAAKGVASGLRIVQAVQPAGGRRFAGQVQQIGGRQLHTRGQLEIVDARVQIQLARMQPAMVFIQIGK